MESSLLPWVSRLPVPSLRSAPPRSVVIRDYWVWANDPQSAEGCAANVFNLGENVFPSRGSVHRYYNLALCAAVDFRYLYRVAWRPWGWRVQAEDTQEFLPF